VTYRRALLERFADRLGEDRWEDHLQSALRAAGIELMSRPEIVVLHRQRTTASRYARQRWLYSRAYAGQRVAGRGALIRVAWGLGALALPPLLVARIVRAVWATGEHRRELLATLPLPAAFVTVWAAGEVAGAWLGPGDAMSRVA
jgi:hypothetical protein